MNSELKVSVYWGDILYDTALCGVDQPFTVGLKAGNSFVLPVEGLNTASLRLVTMNGTDNAEIRFNDKVTGYVHFKDEVLPIQVAKKSKHATQIEPGLYQLRIGRSERASLVIGHVSFYLDWVNSYEKIPRGHRYSKRSLAVAAIGFLLLASFLYVINAIPLGEEVKPPERLVEIENVSPAKPEPTPVAKAAIGPVKTAIGGAEKRPLGKVKMVARKSNAKAAFNDVNLSGLVKSLSSLGNNIPSGRPAGKGDAGMDQVGTGGFSTEGLKTGGGGKSVGIGRTVGQGEGGFEGTGRLGLSGNSLKEGSGTGSGGGSVTRGGLDREVINAVVRRRQDRIRLCYERQLNFFPKLSGKITVAFTIGKTGNVVSSKIVEDTMRNDTVRTCILSEVGGWNFPSPVGGTLVHVDYPFVFESSARGLASP
jgi:hypothetical protein